jgi:hypothetical protein
MLSTPLLYWRKPGGAVTLTCLSGLVASHNFEICTRHAVCKCGRLPRHRPAAELADGWLNQIFERIDALQALLPLAVATQMAGFDAWRRNE